MITIFQTEQLFREGVDIWAGVGNYQEEDSQEGRVGSWGQICVASTPPALGFHCLHLDGACLLNRSATPTAGTCRVAIRSHTRGHPVTGLSDYLAGIAPPPLPLLYNCVLI